jgi:hypothetical protein
MSRFAGRKAVTNPFDATPASIIRDRVTADPFSQAYFDDFGNPTLLPPEPSLRLGISGRLRESAALSSPELLGDAGTVALRSGIDWITAGQMRSERESMRLPGAFAQDVDANRVLLPDGVKEAKDVLIEDLWETFSDIDKQAIGTAGFDVNTLKFLGINNAEDFAQRWPTLLQAVNARQSIERLKEESGAASFAAWTAELGFQLATDPLLWLSLGASRLVKTPAKAAAKETLKEAAKQVAKGAVYEGVDDATKLAAIGTLQQVSGKAPLKRSVMSKIAQGIAEGPSQILARRAIAEGRTKAARGIFQGGFTATGMSSGAAFGFAQQNYDLQMGFADPSNDLDTPWASIAVGGVVGLFFSELGLRMMNRTHGVIKNRTLLESGEVYTLGSEVVSRKSRANPSSLDDIIDVEHVSAAETLEEIVALRYTPEQVRELNEISDLLSSKIEDSAQTIAVRDFLLKMPTHEELKAFLSRDLSSVTELPATQWSKSREELWDLQGKIQEAAASGRKKELKRLRKRQRVAQINYENAVRHLRLNNIGQDKKIVGLANALRQLANDVPIATMQNAAARESEIVRRAQSQVVTDNARPTSLLNRILYMDNWAGRAVRLFNPAMKFKAAMGHDKPKMVFVARLLSLIDNKALSPQERLKHPDGSDITDIRTRHTRMEQRFLEPIRHLSKAVRSSMSMQRQRELLQNTVRAAAGLEDALPETANLVKIIKKMRDEYGRRAAQAGALPALLKDFVPIYFVQNPTKAMEDVFKKVYKRHLKNKFSREAGLDAQPHYNTLAYLGYVVKDKNGKHVVGPNTPADFTTRLDPETGEMLIPLSVADMAPKYRDDYYKALDDGLELDAQLAYNRRLGKGVDYDPDNPDAPPTPFEGDEIQNRRVTNYTRSETSRMLEQQVLLDPEVLESGLVEIDPEHYMSWYHRSTGYNIMRDEAVSEFFGEPVGFNELIRAMRSFAGDDDEVKDLVESLVHIDRSQAGRNRISREGALPAYVVGNFASSAVSAALGPVVMTGFEGALTVARVITGSSTYVNLVGDIKSALKAALDSGEARSKGFETAMDEGSRFAQLPEDTVNSAVRDRRSAKVSRYVLDLTRVLTLERQGTAMLKSLNYAHSFSKLWKYRHKLDRMIAMGDRLSRIVDDPAEATAIAREAGMSIGDYQLLKGAGLLTPDMLKIAKKVNNIDGNALSRRERLRDIAVRLDAEDRKLLEEFEARLDAFAQDDTNNFIATPSASTRAASAGEWTQNPILRLLTAFTSWGTTFQASTMTRVGTSAYHKQAGLLALFVGGEITNQMYRDVIYGGMSIDDAAARWTEEPEKNTAILLSRLPVWGAFNPATGIAHMLAAGYGSGAASVVDSPALSMVDRGISATWTAAKARYNGEEIPESSIRAYERILPGANFWWIRAIDRATEGFETTR